jgi:hypothetical protein
VSADFLHFYMIYYHLFISGPAPQHEIVAMALGHLTIRHHLPLDFLSNPPMKRMQLTWLCFFSCRIALLHAQLPMLPC